MLLCLFIIYTLAKPTGCLYLEIYGGCPGFLYLKMSNCSNINYFSLCTLFNTLNKVLLECFRLNDATCINLTDRRLSYCSVYVYGSLRQSMMTLPRKLPLIWTKILATTCGTFMTCQSCGRPSYRSARSDLWFVASSCFKGLGTCAP